MPNPYFQHLNNIFIAFRSANFSFLLKGKPTRVSVTYNTHSKFAKLYVGKQVVTGKQLKGSKDLPFPLVLAPASLHPLEKVWVNYEPPPKNSF